MRKLTSLLLLSLFLSSAVSCTSATQARRAAWAGFVLHGAGMVPLTGHVLAADEADPALMGALGVTAFVGLVLTAVGASYDGSDDESPARN
jgi:FtsH-binding integral membrane protein